ncbi:diguanylate cyclase [Chitinimonas sp.]|uniref:sensor domain-containing diguanylate cyclase n=1 Tax=Chitinimonas sp. TaxID=1934313 RepID=UPI002F94F4CA
MSRLSLRTALVLAFSIVSVLMAILLSYSLGQLASDVARRDIGTALRELAGQMADRLDLGMYEKLRAVELITSLRQVRDPAAAPSDNRAVLEKLRHSAGEVAWIGFADPRGKVIYSADGVLEGADVSARPWFAGALRGAFVGDVHEAKLLAKMLPALASGEPLRFVDVAAPVYGLDGKLRGVIGAHLSWEWARSVERTVFSAARRSQGVEVFVLNAEGKVLLAPEGLAGVVLPPGLAQSEQETGHLLRWPDGKDYLTTLVRTRGLEDYSGLGWWVLVRQPLAIAYAPVLRLQYLVLAIGVGLAVLFSLFGLWLAGRVARPLAALGDAADRLRAGELAVQIPSELRFTEMRQLANSLRHMVAALKTEQDKLSALNASLEDQVHERTELLNLANEHLLNSLEERQQLVSKLETLASTDSLSELLNRRAFHERAAIELARSSRQGTALSVFIFDIDHFKRINDSYGHETGDQVIVEIARLTRDALRDVDVAARFGGEEFVVLLPDTALMAALQVAERLRLAIAALTLPHEDGPVRFSSSFGVAEWVDGLSLEKLISRADQALYRAKNSGRNRSEAWLLG